MNSETHKANIVKSGYKEVGFAVVNGVLNGEETTLVVQMFGATAAPIAQIPKAEAAGPEPAVVPAEKKIEPAAEPVAEPVTLVPTEPAAVNTTPAPVTAANFGSGFSFERVVSSPRINIPTLTGNVALIVVGLLIGLLAVDAFVIRKKRVVRLAGHNIAHILFLITMVVSGLGIVRGSLL